jgi:hypothetical protein
MPVDRTGRAPLVLVLGEIVPTERAMPDGGGEFRAVTSILAFG